MSGRVVVVGSANVDRTIPIVRAPEQGETVLGGSTSVGPGGKGLNQAVAAARSGAATAFVGAVGADGDGDMLLAALAAEGIDTSAVQRRDEPTGLAVVLLEPDGSNRIVVAPGANSHVDPLPLAAAADDVVVAQLEIPIPAVTAALSEARQTGAITVLNAAPVRTGLGDLLTLVDVLVVNQPELRALASGRPAGDDPVASARRLPCRLGTVVTLGADGALLVTGDAAQWWPAPSVEPVDTTGAGDCFVGSLAAGLIDGLSLERAGEAAVSAASLSVTAAGAAPSMPTAAALAAWYTDDMTGSP